MNLSYIDLIRSLSTLRVMGRDLIGKCITINAINTRKNEIAASLVEIDAILKLKINKLTM